MPTDIYNRLGSLVHKVNKLLVCGFYCMVPLNSGAVATLFDIRMNLRIQSKCFTRLRLLGWHKILKQKFQYRYCVT